MPVTPLHAGISLPFFAAFKRRLAIAPLVIGSFIPDLELLVMLPWTGWDMKARGPMHSLLGMLTIDVAVTLLVTYAIYPYFAMWLKERYGKQRFHIFAGEDITERPRTFGTAMFSAGIGATTHVLWDSWNHPFNPLLWPWSNVPALNFVPPGDPLFVTVFAHIVTAVMLIWVLSRYWRN